MNARDLWRSDVHSWARGYARYLRTKAAVTEDPQVLGAMDYFALQTALLIEERFEDFDRAMDVLWDHVRQTPRGIDPEINVEEFDTLHRDIWNGKIDSL